MDYFLKAPYWKMFFLTLGIFISVNSISIISIQAQFGNEDISFGKKGRIITDFNKGSDLPHSIVVQKDRKILVVGTCSNPDKQRSYNNDICLVRYNEDGTVDGSFGVKGKVMTDVNNSLFDEGISVALQDDGGIFVTGCTKKYDQQECDDGGTRDLVLVHYSSDGNLDKSFGNGGIVIMDPGNSLEEGIVVVLQPDGKILLGARIHCYDEWDFMIVRYEADGSLDKNFGSEGVVVTNLSRFDYLTCLALQMDGKIIVAGSGHHQSFILRYNIDGSMDESFGENGSVINSSMEGIYGLDIDELGRVVVGGNNDAGLENSRRAPADNLVMVRYNIDGSIDKNFGKQGHVVMDLGDFPDGSPMYSDECIFELQIQPDGKMMTGVVSDIWDYTNEDLKLLKINYELVCYNDDGSIDSAFGKRGRVLVEFDKSINTMSTMALQSDGKVLVAGSCFTKLGLDFAIERCNSTYTDTVYLHTNTATGQTTATIRMQLTDALVQIINELSEVIMEKKNFNGNNFSFEITDVPAGIYYFYVKDYWGKETKIRFLKK